MLADVNFLVQFITDDFYCCASFIQKAEIRIPGTHIGFWNLKLLAYQKAQIFRLAADAARQIFLFEIVDVCFLHGNTIQAGSTCIFTIMTMRENITLQQEKANRTGEN